ncbi:MAG TPA: hypothetical protein VGB98_19390 [Pyrinomonadaceae bacterium]|jgi:hypothetical protein
MSTPQQPPAGAAGHTIEEALAAIDGATAVSFDGGEFIMTPGARSAVIRHSISPARLLGRHNRGDWGDVSERDRLANEDALKNGGRIWSVYNFDGLEEGRLYIITDAADDDGKRHATTLLLPSEY